MCHRYCIQIKVAITNYCELFNYHWNHYLVTDCPLGLEYRTCGWNITCNDIGNVKDCKNSTCDSGCFCSNGTVLEDGVCVDPDTCPSRDLLYCKLVHKTCSILTYNF